MTINEIIQLDNIKRSQCVLKGTIIPLNMNITWVFEEESGRQPCFGIFRYVGKVGTHTCHHIPLNNRDSSSLLLDQEGWAEVMWQYFLSVTFLEHQQAPHSTYKFHA